MLDVMIIGAGPAGSVAALSLARRGRHVTLIEQHAFPRDKVCGECISALGIDVLTRLGLTSSLRALNPILLTEALIHAPDGHSARVSLPSPMWGLSRCAMDHVLLELARSAGVSVHQPMRCERIETAACPVVHLRDLTTNQRETRRPDWVLLADGKGALLPARPKRTTDFGFKAHFTGIDGPRNAIELFGVHGHYGGVAPIEGGQWNVAFSIPAALLEHFRGNLDALFASLMKQNRTLAIRFGKADRVSDWLASPLPRFAVARDWPARLIPLGNAAAAIEPIGGEGMGLAMRSAELAAEFLCDLSESQRDGNTLRRRFNRLWHTRRIACRAAAKIVASPALADSSIALLAANIGLGERMLGWIGKA